MTTLGEFVVARRPGLLRLAVLLNGSAHAGEDPLQSTFSKVLRHWAPVMDAGSPEAYTAKILANEQLSRGHDCRTRGLLPAVVP